MESMMKLPDDMFRLELLPYLIVQDIVNLDYACMNHKYRSQLMEKISGVILLGDKDQSIKASLFKWLGIRRIYWVNMNLLFENDSSFSSSTEIDYTDQFRYTQHVVMRGPIIDETAIFIISHCPSLLSIDISADNNDIQTTDFTLQSIAEHCTGLQSLSLKRCREIADNGMIIFSENCPYLQSLEIIGGSIKDASIISISTYCTGLQSLNLGGCGQITDASIISISTNCTGLQSLNLFDCQLITDASIISISTNCTGLQSLDLDNCYQITDTSIISISTHCTGLQSLILYCEITDASIISISTHCTRLQSLYLVGCGGITDVSIISISTHCTRLQLLNLSACDQITDDSIISMSTHCTGLQTLNLSGCDQLTDASIIPISENCTGLKELYIPYTVITDASLIAIAKNCTGLQYLSTDDCDSLSSDVLRDYFDSLSKLRTVILSIYPSLPI